MTSTRWPTALRLLALLLVVVLGVLWLRRSRTAPAPSPFVPVTVAPARAATTLHGLVDTKTRPGAGGLHLDLYLPAGAGAAKAPPLLVFLEGGRWSTPDDKMLLGASVADTLQRRGMAVAWLTFELGPTYSLAAATTDVTARLRDLARSAEAHHFDGARITLAGHGLGATMAAMIALAPEPSVVARVLAMRGTYDFSDAALQGNPDESLLVASAPTAEERVALSPMARARAGAPPFLFLGASDDGAEWAARAHAFMRALERAGSHEMQLYMVPNRDPRSLANFAGEGNEVGELVASFVASGPTPQPIDGPWGAKQRWTSTPPLEHEAFWAWGEEKRLVVTRPIDARFEEAMGLVFQGVRYELHVLPGKAYEAIPLRAYLEARPEAEVGRGEHLVVTNIRGEQTYLTRADLTQHQPLLVIGIDDERNLYRLSTWYRLKREYSWKPGDAPSPPTMIRPTGPFLFFPGGAPERLRTTTLAPFGLTPASFRFVEKDPLAAARASPPVLREALIGREGCLTCHALHGEGARAHHVRAADGKAHGGFALPLEEYPPDVLHRFLFEQETVAEGFGVGPLKVSALVAHAIEDVAARH